MANEFSATSLSTFQRLWGGGTEPYVHSHYNFFYRTTRVYSIKHGMNHPLANEITKLDNLIDNLRTRTREIYKEYGVDMDDANASNILWDKLNKNPQLDFFRATQRYLNTSQGVNAILTQFTVNQDAIGTFFNQNLGNKLTSPQTLGSMIDTILKDKIFFNSQTKSLEVKGGKSAGIGKALANMLNDHHKLTSTSRDSVIYKELREYLLSRSDLIQGTANKSSIVTSILNGTIRELKNAGITYTQNDVDQYRIFLERNINFEKLTKDAMTRQLAAGTIGEQLHFDLMGQGNNTDIWIVGGDLEKKVRERIAERLHKDDESAQKLFIDGAIKSLRDENKQSYSDIIIWNNGKPIRIQSKTYTGAMDAFNDRGRGSMGDVRQRMTVMEDVNVLEFITEMKSAIQNNKTFGTTENDMAEFGYTVANEVWFATAGGIVGGTHDDPKVRPFPISKATIDATLTSIFIDYLGLMIDEEWNIQTDMSNLFFLIDANFLLPTYVFLEGLRIVLLNGQDSMANVRAYLSYEQPNESAVGLARSKWDSLIGESEGMNYPDNLSLIGQTVGHNILMNSKIHINAETSLKDLATSSYNILSYIEKAIPR